MEMQLDAVGETVAVPVVRDQGEVAVAQLKRLLVGLGSIYLLFAVIGRFVEGMGAVECGCSADCWCKRPVLSLFRWVFPYRHRGSQACGSPTANTA
jgi:hypothetical protein